MHRSHKHRDYQGIHPTLNSNFGWAGSVDLDQGGCRMQAMNPIRNSQPIMANAGAYAACRPVATQPGRHLPGHTTFGGSQGCPDFSQADPRGGNGYCRRKETSRQQFMSLLPTPLNSDPQTPTAERPPVEDMLSDAEFDVAKKPRLSSFACDMALRNGTRPKSRCLTAALSKGRKKRCGKRS